VSEREEQVEGGEELPVLGEEAKEAILESVEEGYESPPRSESVTQEGGPEAEERPPLDLNDAAAEELSDLPGIGPTLAGRIVAYRMEEGPFREAAEIVRVRGISKATYEAIADRITVGPVAMVDWGQEEAEEAEGVEEPEAALPSPEEGETYVAPLVTADEVGEAEEPAEKEAAAPLPPPPERFRPMPSPPRGGTRRGAGWGSLLLVGLLSALGGALLALLVLFLLNGGTLDWERATSRAIDREVSQLEGQLGELRTELEQARQRLGGLEELSRRLDEVQAQMEAMGGAIESLQLELTATAEGLGDVRQTLAGLSDDLTSVAESVTALEGRVDGMSEQLGELDEQLLALRRAVGRFDTFLAGLRGLLEETMPGAREQTPTPTPAKSSPGSTPTPTPAEASPTPASQVTVIPLASPTP
jgi:competence ComEA-like helix-hairpin-helix protein